MFIGNLPEVSRRAFLRRSAQLASLGAASSYALGLTGIGEAAAFDASDGYKALVCVFLLGGNDHNNTIIPFDPTNYARYREIRGLASDGTGVGLTRSDLTATVLAPPDDQQLTDDLIYAVAPTMPHLKARFDAGHMAPLLNVGPLIAPLTRAEYENSNHVRYPRPAKLFSHNDQQSTWQSSLPEGARSGWGGRMADLAQSHNTNAMFTGINASGNTVFLSGENFAPYQVNGSGAIKISGYGGSLLGSRAAGAALQTILGQHNGSVLANDYAHMTARSLQYGEFVNNALGSVDLTTQFDSGNSLARQLELVARLIGGRGSLGVKRQVFMVSMGGFDTHDGLPGKHPGLLAALDSALNSFYQATAELGVADKVTTFTASDFGRTLTSNGDGSDHGWGSHHFIIGGAVNGGRFYGTAPHISINSDDQVKQGRLLPSTSVDEYSATLAKWFGVSASEMPSVAPNIARFAAPDLGFMQTT